MKTEQESTEILDKLGERSPWTVADEGTFDISNLRRAYADMRTGTGAKIALTRVGFGYRQIDRALQILRKAGLIEHRYAVDDFGVCDDRGPKRWYPT